jgi:hypothetical protein
VLVDSFGDFGNQLARQRELVGARQDGVAVFVEQDDGVVVLAEGVVADIPYQQGDAFFSRLAAPYSIRFSDSAAKPTQ